MRPFWLALQFLTRLPTPRLDKVSDRELGLSLAFYPVVGLIIGALLYLAAQLLAVVSPLFSAAFVVALWLCLTGALHVDGLADMADAWVGGHGDRERTLAIMKDPYCGPMGVSAVVVVLLLKFAAITVVLESLPLLILLAPVVGRGLVLLLMLTTPYCRQQGLASAMVTAMPRRLLWATLLLIGVVIVALLQWLAGPLLLALLLFYYLYRRALMQRLGGYSGDGAGALIDLAEVMTLMVGTVIMSL